MISRKPWVGFAVLALLSGGCELCRGVGRVARLATDPEFIKYGSQGPPASEQTDTSGDPPVRENLPACRPTENGMTLSNNPPAEPTSSPHNALVALAGNKFSSWTMSPRLCMPVAATSPP